MNPQSALRCDCGFDFSSTRATQDRERNRSLQDAKQAMVKGGLLAGGGFALSVAQLLAAEARGGIRIALHAPVVLGIAWFFRGWTLWRRLSSGS